MIGCLVVKAGMRTAATGMCVTSVMASASNSSVKPEPGLAHGTSTRRTPQLSHLMRGVLAERNA